ncbi:MAG: amylovoran biosynthesis glycosyltransferase AmsB [Psychromonas sp.]|jgi:amylovoran biosynthesis glycosyltransferase AmsB|uniref:glycosyltransferase family 2 protein n=1 Tax=Psychromonas sp. TaxID=1884585 RepID=UPI0039E58CEB
MHSIQSCPYFSVVIPVYNRSNLIKAVLESVLKQSYNDFEIILVDDYSNDIEELKQLIEHISDDKITLIEHGENKNGAAARNTGIKAAEGQYICFLDSDDTWPLNRLAIVKESIERSKHPNSTIFYGQVCYEYPDKKTKGTLSPLDPIGSNKVADYLFVHNGLLQTSTITCSREVALKVGFDERYRRHQDYDFCLRAEALAMTFQFINKPLSNWAIYGGESTIKKGATFEFCQFWLTEMEQYFSAQAKSSYLIKVLFPIAIETGNFSSAFNILVKNAKYVPINILITGVYRGLKSIIKYIIRPIK